jgi:hypothetical protein
LRKKERKKNYDGYQPPPPPKEEEDRTLPSITQLSHWLHANWIPKISCHYFWPGLTALPKNTLSNVLSLVNTERKKTKKTRGVSHCGLAIYIKKDLNAKKRIMETQIFHHEKI